MDTGRRDTHPYHMHEEIRSQPGVVSRALEAAEDAGAEVSRVLARARRVIFTGCGSSWHAALGAHWQLQLFTRGRIESRAIEAHDLVAYFPALRPDDVVVAVTQSGETATTLRALERAHRAGCETIAVTGNRESSAGRRVRHLLPTGFMSVHTAVRTTGYTAALAATCALANTLAEAEERLDLSPLPEVINVALTLEEMAHRLAAGMIVAERYQEPPVLILTGAGPNRVTALESTRQLAATGAMRASAWGVEEMMHGPLVGAGPNTLVIMIVPGGRATERAVDVVAALRERDVTPVALVTEENAEAFEDAHRLVLPDMPEVLSPIPCIVPLQFFSYYLAIGKGLDPDSAT
jgi:glucosamine--fructose-6-phosphate aminotransferase (isomerizing)